MSKTRLIDAVSRLDVDCATTLLQARPDLIHVTTRSGQGLLHLACAADATKLGVPARRALDLVAFLLDNGVDVDSTLIADDYPCNSVFFATRGNNLRLIEYLVKRGATPRGLFAAGFGENLPLLKLLIRLGAEVDEHAEDETPFLHTWKYARFKAARLLLAAGADVNFQDSKGVCALRVSLEKKHPPQRFAFLLEHGANPDLEDARGVSPRLRASRMRDKRYIRVLQKSNAAT